MLISNTEKESGGGEKKKKKQFLQVPGIAGATRVGTWFKAKDLPSTSDVSKVTLAALRLPAGRFKPILSSFSLKDLPPFLDLALWQENKAEIHCGVAHVEEFVSGGRDKLWGGIFSFEMDTKMLRTKYGYSGLQALKNKGGITLFLCVCTLWYLGDKT